MIVVGYLLYQESLDIFVFFGASLILTGNFINMHKESRKAQS
jgi:drug/metabolite transporter (DMT)-like permease